MISTGSCPTNITTTTLTTKLSTIQMSSLVKQQHGITTQQSATTSVTSQQKTTKQIATSLITSQKVATVSVTNKQTVGNFYTSQMQRNGVTNEQSSATIDTKSELLTATTAILTTQNNATTTETISTAAATTIVTTGNVQHAEASQVIMCCKLKRFSDRFLNIWFWCRIIRYLQLLQHQNL